MYSEVTLMYTWPRKALSRAQTSTFLPQRLQKYDDQEPVVPTLFLGDRGLSLHPRPPFRISKSHESSPELTSGPHLCQILLAHATLFTDIPLHV